MKKMKRLLTLALAMCMVLSLAATPVFAAEPYVVNYDVKLALGKNALTLDPSAVTTVYEFEPEEAGVYRFEASDANALVGYWGGGSFFVSDQTENKTNVLEFTLPNAGPSIMVGISGVRSCTLTVTRVGDTNTVVEPEWTQYENKATPRAYKKPSGKLIEVDVYDNEIDTAVLGGDGYYHLGSATGPVLIANLNHSTASLSAAMSYGQVRRYYFNADGSVQKKVDFYEALEEYLACADGAMYPVTEDIKTMYVELGESKGWYDKSILGNYLFDNVTVDPDEAWMFACSYCPLSGFNDVSLDGWYHESFDYMLEKGYMSGTGKSTMEPATALTRAMAVQILYNAAGSPSISGMAEPFGDVKEGEWHYEAIVWAYNEDVTKGTGGDSFSPGRALTRQELVTLLYRRDGEPEVSGSLNGFSDAGQVSGFAKNAMIWAVDQGLVLGAGTGSDRKLMPLSNASRAEGAAILMRYLKNKEA